MPLPPRLAGPLRPFELPARPPKTHPPTIRLEDYEATLKLDHEEVFVETIPYVIGDMIGDTIRVQQSEPNLLVTDNLGQRLILLPHSKIKFEWEESRIPVFFEFDDGVDLRAYLWEATLRAVRNPGTVTLARDLKSPEA
jgi:hypothetical protein